MRIALAALLLLAALGCAAERPADPLEAERELTPELLACAALPQVEAYLAAVKERIFEAWRLPAGLEPDLELTLLLRIDSSGEVYGAMVLDAGASDLEESAMDAVEAARPYPPVPPDADCIKGTALRLSFRNPLQR